MKAREDADILYITAVTKVYAVVSTVIITAGNKIQYIV